MEVLSVASEVFPLVKTGGLADVAGALPRALAGEGIKVRTLVPGYPIVMREAGPTEVLHRYADFFGGDSSLRAARPAGLDLLVLDAPHLFHRPGGPYGDASGADWPDNWRRFAAFGKAGADLAGGRVAGYAPDLVHAHDWQAGMVPAYLRYGNKAPIPSIMTVHNLAFQGHFPAGVFPALGLPAEAMSVDGVEYYGGVGFLKAGLQAASAITTVSPTYAQEIRTPEFGMGLQGLLNHRAGAIHGIVNGIDTEVWDPASDRLLAAPYSARSLKARAVNKRAVEERFGLDQENGPLLCVVSRLAWQKGMDMLAVAADAIIAMGARLAVLGAGEKSLEAALSAAAARHPRRIGLVIGYDDALSHLLQGGSDAILIPSRFEPCGLTQLYGLRYGCVPIVARTGGLADTVIDANEAALSAGVATGFQFTPASGEAFLQALSRALAAFRNPPAWKSLQVRGMKTDVSWKTSAAEYAALYRTLAAR
jgi:starch synthase